MDQLHKTLILQRKETERLATNVADDTTTLGGTPKEVVEALELLRYQLHLRIDEIVDAEQLKRPSGGNAWRARRYREIEVPAV